MLKDERLEKIECLVNERKYVAISDLMLELSISKATVRRDLELLSEGGKLAITRGGAVSVSGGTTYELPYLEKKKVNHEEKIRIAHFAAALVKPGETILIDAGTTCIEMVPFLRERGNIMVATNDLMIALELGRCPNIETILIGGVLRKDFNTTSG
ncbi:MAG: DeoR/GlpR family DNA-binding transcription regulator, partial [Oscillospiraceae bacterium]